MVSKNNKSLQRDQSVQRFQRFSLRKLSIGVVSVAIAAGFYFGDLTPVQADTVAFGNDQKAVTNTDNAQTDTGGQTVVLGSAAQTVASAAPTQSATPVSTSASSQVPVATAAEQSQATNATQENAKEASVDMYTQGDKSSHSATIAANAGQVVGVSGSFEVTKKQLANADSIMIGTITQSRSDSHNQQNIPVLIRTRQQVINVSQDNGQRVKLGELHFDKDELGNIVLSLQNINHKITFNDDKKINFAVQVAFDLNHAADSGAYEKTAYPQTVTFNFNGKRLYQLTVKQPTFKAVREPQNFYISTPNVSGEEGIFSVYGNYVSASEFNSFLADPLSAQPANLPDNYQWGVNITGSQRIAGIRIHGGAPLEALFDLSGTKVQTFHNNSTIPLWEMIASTQAADNLSLNELKAQQAAQQYEGLLWSRQSDGSVNLWFNWSRTRLHTDWVNAVNQKYGNANDGAKDGVQMYRDSLKNYFKKSLYSTLPGVDPDKFVDDNVNAYYHFLGDNPLIWYQEIHVVNYDPTVSNEIKVKVNNKVLKTIETIENEHHIQGHSFVKVHFVNADSGAKDLSNAEVLLPQGPMLNDGETKRAWQGERNLVNFSTLSGYDIVQDDQQINTLVNKWGVSTSKVLKSTSATITFPEKEGVTDEYYVFVKPQPKTINLSFVDDDEKGQLVKDAPATSVSGPVGTTMALSLPDDLAKRGYLLNQQIFTIAYNSDGKPAFEVDGNGNAVVHLRHKKTTKRIEKEVKRTINVTLPNGNQQAPIIQIARPFHDDSYDEVTHETTPGLWSADTMGWGSVDTSPIKSGGHTYKPVIMQVVTNPDGTTTETRLDSITSHTVDNDTLPTTINVVYQTTATAKLTGTGSATYTGAPITEDDLNNGLKVTVTGPTANAGTFIVYSRDVEFSLDGTHWTTELPTYAHTYQVRLTEQGKTDIKNKYGNVNLAWTDQTGKSTITSDATFTINPVSAVAKLNNLSEGNYTKVYDGAATTNVDPSKFGVTVKLGEQTIKLDTTDLTSTDFAWTDSKGQILTKAPQNVGTYYVRLTDHGLTVLQAHNQDFTLNISGLGTYTITPAQASATLSGKGTRAYNGAGVTVDDLNAGGITLTLRYPKNGDATYSTDLQLTADDYAWNTPDGKAPVEANSQAYTLSLKTDVIKQLIEQAVGSGQNGQSNVRVADGAITGTASYVITPLESEATLSGDYGKTYDATTTTQIDPTQTKLSITTTMNDKTIELNTTGLTGSDFEWVGLPDGTYPKNVGTYYIELTNSGLDKLKNNNPNFALTKSGQGTYTIKQAQGSAKLVGHSSKTYNGQAVTTAEINHGGQITVKLSFPGADPTASYNLQDGDYTITPTDVGNIGLTDAGSYKITLTTAGKAHVRAALKECSSKEVGGQANATVADDAIDGDATFTVYPSSNVVNVSGTQTVAYTGKPVNVVYNTAGTNSVKVNLTADTGSTVSLDSVRLDSGDFQVVDTGGNPVTAVNANGNYHIVLTTDGVNKIQKAAGKNYQIAQGNGYGTLIINKAAGSANFGGNRSVTYTGNADSNYLNGFSVTLNEPGNPVYKLVADDVEFNVAGTWTTTVPMNVGTYDVRLSKAGWDHIKAINGDNIAWPDNATAGTGTYTITAAKATVALSGKNAKVYDGHAVVNSDLYTDGSTIAVSIMGDNITNLPTSYTLTAGDYTWNTPRGAAPQDVGDHTITLTDTGLANVQAAIDRAVGVGNVVLSKTDTGSADFEITQAIAPNIRLDGELKKQYNGQVASFDPNNAEAKANYHFNNVKDLIIPDLTAADFSWFTKETDGTYKLLSVAPSDAGYYYLQLNDKGKDAFASANKNYAFTGENGQSMLTGAITYYVYPAILKIGVSGTASKVYDGSDAVVAQSQLDGGQIKLVCGELPSELAGLSQFKLTPDDLEVIDAADHAVSHVNVHENGPVYYVRLKTSALDKIKALPGAKNYDISMGDNTGHYLIYAQKAQVTLTGNQTTSYGTALALDPSKYAINLTNWINSSTKPTSAEIVKAIGGFEAGDVLIKGYGNDKMPTDVGSYQVMISSQLLARLKKAYPDYDFASAEGIDAEHSAARYVITQAVATVKINGEQRVRYGEDTTIKYGGGGYTITITAPVGNSAQPIYKDVKLTADDLQFEATPGNVGTYQVELSKRGIDKLKASPDAANYDWSQASKARANFFVDRMPVTITIGGGTGEVTYGSDAWLDVIKNNPQGYNLTVKTPNDIPLTYEAKDGDLVFSQTPGDVGSYDVVLSDQGLANIKAAFGTNYEYPQTVNAVTTHVNQGEVTVTLNGNGNNGKTYDGKAATPADLDVTKFSYDVTKFSDSATIYIYKPDGNPVTMSLTNDDLQFVDAQGNAITPTNAGTYAVALSPSGQSRLAALTGNNGNNYKWTFNTKASYTITAATNASATLSGANQMIFNGAAVTAAQLNNGGNIAVSFTFPGSTQDSTYQLQDGDYDWYSGEAKLSSAPRQTGNYTIKLTSTGLAHLQTALNGLAGAGNVTLSADQLSGSAQFEITAKPLADVTLSNIDQSKSYDGRPADLDMAVKATGLVTDTPLSSYGITAGDFDWYNDNGIRLTGAPINVGTYKARLTSRALAALQAANPNYSFDTVGGTVNYTITAVAATDTFGGSTSKVYDGHGTATSGVLKLIKRTPSGLIDGDQLDLSALTDLDYYWTTKDGEVMTGLPTNVGTYYLKLKTGSIDRVKNANPNYRFANDAIGGKFTYTITAATGEATLSGQADKDYDGQAVTTAALNGTNGNIQVRLAFPGSTDTTYQLQDGDYIWNTPDGKAPLNAGTYTIEINPAKLQSIIDSVAGAGNVTIEGNTGSATLTINKRNLSVTLGDKVANTGKTYDGQAAVIDPAAGSFTADGLVDGESLNTTDISASDYEWQDEAGNALKEAPVSVGTYYVALSADGLHKLQADNPNYNVTESGRFKYVISPATAKIKVAGSQESTSAEIDGKDYVVTGPSGIKIPEGLTYQIVGNPTRSGVFAVDLTPDSVQKLQAANRNYDLTIVSDAKFTLDATLTIAFMDTADGNKQVGQAITKTGIANSIISDLGLKIPENYELASNQILPTSYKFGQSLSQNLNLKLIHKTVTIDPTNLDPKNTDLFKYLAKKVTRTIEYRGLSAAQLSQLPAEQSGVQTVSFTRTILYDLVTGKIVPNSEGVWTAADGNDKWAGFMPHIFAGYTADRIVPEVTVNGDDQNSKLTVTYTANPQVGKIVYKDGNGNVIDSTALRGVTDEDISVKPAVKAPAGWKIVDENTIPATVRATADGIPEVDVRVQHIYITVYPDNPKTATDSLPDNPNDHYPAGVDYSDLHKTVTRKITVNKPNQKPQTVAQVAYLSRSAEVNEVTHEVSYDNWILDDNGWQQFIAPLVAGYTASGNVDAEKPDGSSQDATVTIIYTANPQKGKISYVDSEGHEISRTDLFGVTDEHVKITPQLPAGWVLATGEQVPTEVVATASGIPTVIVKIQHGSVTVDPDDPKTTDDFLPDNPSKKYPSGVNHDNLKRTINRTITVRDPHNGDQVIYQSVQTTRKATVDEVTGEVIYGDWLRAELMEFVVPTVAGYTPSVNRVDRLTVDGNAEDSEVKVTYTANEQTGKISYVDKDNQEVGHTDLKGHTDENIELSPVAPTGWKISAEVVPTRVKASADGIEPVIVRVEHGHVTVEPNAPKTSDDVIPNAGGKYFPSGVAHDDLNKTITRTITVKDPHRGDQVIIQRVTSHRTAVVDMVDRTVVYGDWTIETLPEFSIPVVAGYTPDYAMISERQVTGASKDIPVTIKYFANAQHGFIQYVDRDGNTIASTPFDSTIDMPVAIVPHAPAGWKISDPASVPSTVTPQPDQETVVKIQIEHDHVTVLPTDPKTPSDVIPNDAGKHFPSGVGYDDLNKIVTRTINVSDDTGTLIPYDVIDTVNLSRTATVDMVTGEVTYSDWLPGSGFPDWVAPTITGYTPDYIVVFGMTPDGNTTAQRVSVVYHANAGQQTIKFVDGNQVIDSQVVDGKVDHEVAVPNGVPAGWRVAEGVVLPTTVKIKAADQPLLIPIVHIIQTIEPGDGHDKGTLLYPDDPNSPKYPRGVASDDLNRTLTRTITINTPNMTPEVIEQSVHFVRGASFDEVSGAVTYGKWMILDNGLMPIEVPKVKGYTSQTKVDGIPAPSADDDLADVVVNYDPDLQTGKISYVDGQGNEIKHDVISGKTGETIRIKPVVPAGWRIILGTNILAMVEATAEGLPTVMIQVEHDHVTVMPNDSKTSADVIPNAGGKHFPNGVGHGDLNRTVTREITIISPDNHRTITKQTAELQRIARVDIVTGDVEYGDWIVVDNGWGAFDVPAISGYTPRVKKVAEVDVDSKTVDAQVEITYDADRQTGLLRYVDPAGNEVAHAELAGHTGDHIAINPQAPAGWVVAGAVPNDVIAGPNGIPLVTIHVKHGAIIVRPGDLPNAGDKKSGSPSKKPGDGTPSQDITHNDLHRDVTRTIIIHHPLAGDQADVETINYERTAAIDDVDGSVTYGEWVPTQNSVTGFSNVDYPVIAGYTMQATQGSHGEEVLSQDQINTWTDPLIEVSYVAKEQKQAINYLDEAGKVLSTSTIYGKTGERVVLAPAAPEHYEIKSGQSIPKRVTLTADNPAIVIVVVPKMNPVADSATIVRTITINVPGKAPQVIKQSAMFTRTGKTNEVTGQTTYAAWKLTNNGLVAVDVPRVPGYEASLPAVGGIKDPTVDTKLADINVNYTAVEQVGKISYQDRTGKEVGSTPISGRTGDIIDVKPVAPTGWQFVANQRIPETVIATANGISTVIIRVEHVLVPVRHTEPVASDARTATGKLITGAHGDDLNKTVTRTINVTLPTGKVIVIKQAAHLYRDAAYDDVTGAVAYGSWSTSVWEAYTPTVIPGYTADKTVAAQTVTGDTVDTMVKVGYAADKQAVTIRFVDDDANAQVGAETVKTGRTGQILDDLDLAIPAHYLLATGQVLPVSYTFTATPDQVITIHLTEKRVTVDPATPETNPDPQDSDWFKERHLVKRVVRTIIDELPGESRLVNQTATIYRTATYNEVTGQLTNLSAWSTDTWDGYQMRVPAGYTAKVEQLVANDIRPIHSIDSETVTTATPSQVIMITYVPESMPTSPTTPIAPTTPANPTVPIAPTTPTSPTTPVSPLAPESPSSSISLKPELPLADHPVITARSSDDRTFDGNSNSSRKADEGQGRAKQLPQTGNGRGKQATTLGLAFTVLAGLLGMTGAKKKKEDK